MASEIEFDFSYLFIFLFFATWLKQTFPFVGCFRSPLAILDIRTILLNLQHRKMLKAKFHQGRR